MISLNTLLRISVGQITNDWRIFARKAYIEPIVIEDGFQRYVLMSVEDYKALTTATAETPKTPE